MPDEPLNHRKIEGQGRSTLHYLLLFITVA